jgi:predicted metal-dependent phosphotriesterase family hydrolase
MREVSGHVVRTLAGDLTPQSLGLTLAHEHVYSAFEAATGDGDLDFTDDRAISEDLSIACRDGVSALVEMSTYDMGASPQQVTKLCSACGIIAVKSTGWFRSPYADTGVAGKSVGELASRLTADIMSGFEGTELHAGLIGEVGLTGISGTHVERRILEATAAAADSTGAGIAVHTDDWANACAIVDLLTGLGVPPTQLMVGHMRCADPLAGQVELARSGVTLGFDQLGHPKRDSVEQAAERIVALVSAGVGKQLALSADVGRRSRLLSRGGSGYSAPIFQLVDSLRREGTGKRIARSLTGGAVTHFLALRLRGHA